MRLDCVGGERGLGRSVTCEELHPGRALGETFFLQGLLGGYWGVKCPAYLGLPVGVPPAAMQRLPGQAPLQALCRCAGS